MRPYFVLLFLCAVASAKADAGKKYALIFGGAAEPAGSKTIFDAPFDQMSKVLKKGGYSAQVVFDGGHSETESLAEKYFPKKRKDATWGNIDSAVRELAKDIREGRIAKGDQLVVVNLNHGLPKELVTNSHPVSAQGGRFNMDDLVALRDEAEKAGVKLAIVDHSCYSGASIALANPNTCVVSATGPDTVGYISEIEAFWDQAKPGRSFEETFLKGRKRGQMPTSPRISGIPGQKADEALKNVQRHLLNYKDDILNRLQNAKNCATCFEGLKADIAPAELAAIASAAGFSDRKLRKLKGRVEAHAKAFMSLESIWKIEQDYSKRTEKIADELWRWDTLSDFSIADSTKIFTKLREEEKSKSLRDFYEKTLMGLPKIEERRKQLQDDAEYKKYLEAKESVKQHTKEVHDAAQAVGKLERELYDTIYDDVREEKPNPCAQFSL